MEIGHHGLDHTGEYGATFEEQRERIEKELFPDPQNNQIQKGVSLPMAWTSNWTTCAASHATART